MTDERLLFHELCEAAIEDRLTAEGREILKAIVLRDKESLLYLIHSLFNHAALDVLAKEKREEGEIQRQFLEQSPFFERSDEILSDATSEEPPFFHDEDLEMDRIARLAAEHYSAPSVVSNAPAKELSPPTAAKPNKYVLPSIPLQVSIPLLLIVFGILSFFEWNPPSSDKDIYHASEKDRSVAVLTNYADVDWSEGTRVPLPGEPLSAGSLRFHSGSIEMLFFNGVRTIIEGPADLLLINESQVFCKRGRWSVTVPEQGVGFELQTPNLTIRDLGTQFFADIEGGKSELHVIKGLVETEKNDGEKLRFQTDQAVSFQGSELFERMASDIARFVTKTEMRQRYDAFFRHLATTKPGTPKSGPIRRLDFDQPSPSDATLFGGRLIEGALPESKAYQFSEPTGRIRLRSVEKCDAATFVVTLRVDRLNNEINPILMSEGTTRSGLVWHILPDGRFIVGMRYQKSYVRGIFRTPIILTPEMIGQWMTLAWTLEGKSGKFTVYAEGDPVYSGTLPSAAWLKMDALDIGSWKLKSGNSAKIHHVDGAVADFQLFDRVLTMEEIRALSNNSVLSP